MKTTTTTNNNLYYGVQQMAKTNLTSSFLQGYGGKKAPSSDLAKKNPKTKSLWEKSDKQYGQPEKA